MNLIARIKASVLGGFSLIPVALILVFFLAACGGASGEETAPSATEAMEEQPAASTEMPVVTDAPMTVESTEAPEVTVGEEGGLSFANDVLPIINSRCWQCHGGERTEKGLNLLSYPTLIAGSENGPVVIAGDADASKLVELISTQKMPKRGAKLTPSQVQVFIDWINQGALDN
jgi:hypothetical protein